MSSNEPSSEADGYMLLAEAAIEMARYPHELREWWIEETLRRAKYGLSPEQEDKIVAMCRARVAAIESEADDHAII